MDNVFSGQDLLMETDCGVYRLQIPFHRRQARCKVEASASATDEMEVVDEGTVAPLCSSEEEVEEKCTSFHVFLPDRGLKHALGKTKAVSQRRGDGSDEFAPLTIVSWPKEQ